MISSILTLLCWVSPVETPPAVSAKEDIHASPSRYHQNQRNTKSRKRLTIKRKHPFPRVTQALNSSWRGHFSATNFRKNTKDNIALQHIKKNIKTVIASLPKEHTAPLKSLQVRNKKHTSRGMANSKKMILHTASIDNEDELISVFVHELGHIVDLGTLKNTSGGQSEFRDGKTPIFKNDISLKFYRISWKNSKERKETATRADFVSGYSLSSPFEDFAESYLFYRLHGEKFRQIAKKSNALQKKYDFMKQYVFENKEFQKGKVTPFAHGVIWDSTLLDIDEKRL